MATSDQVYRFAVGAPESPRSAVYRVWAPAKSSGKSDVYIALRRMGQEFKVSLHGRTRDLDPRGHLAVSRHVQQLAGLEDRFLRVWERSSDEIKSAPDFEVFLLGSELRVEPPIEDRFDDVHWLVPPAPEGVLVVSLTIDSSAAADAQSAGAAQSAQVLARFELADGSYCVLRSEEHSIVPDEFRVKIERAKARMRSEPQDFAVGQPAMEDPLLRTIIGAERIAGGPIAVWIEVDLSARSRTSAA